MKYIKLDENAVLIQPRSGDAGIDLRAIGTRWLFPFVPVMVSTGIAIELPKGYYGRIAERSSVGGKGIAVRGGVVDTSYRGELKVVLHNLSFVPKKISKGDKIAQLIITPYRESELTEVEELTKTTRGIRGFGSTGR